ncbi:hypothetical protein [Streptomyces sp. NPDC006463]|uniref:hypothetical protein n=1 Tax=Streptomyces sp. NPDC006463 TaxID=3364746 RepID=UPI00368B54B1
MKLPAAAVAATTRVDVVRISAPPQRWGDAMTGELLAHWEGPQAAEALTVIGKLPAGRINLCRFDPGWGIRAYGDDGTEPLFEAAFCYGCDQVWLWGAAVPGHLGLQLFDAASPYAQYLRLRFRSA